MSKDEELNRLLSRVDSEEILSLTRRLIQTPSCPPDFQEGAIAAIIGEKLSSFGISHQVMPLQQLPAGGHDRANLTATIGAENGRHLLLCGHMDTVPPLDHGKWTYPPFSAHIEGEKLYGRGSVDMKSGLACLVMALCYLKTIESKLAGRITLLATAGEEVGLEGTKAFLQEHGVDEYDAVLVGEASGQTLYTAQRGVLWMELQTDGIAAHAGISYQGVNALDEMITVLECLDKCSFAQLSHPLLGKTLINKNTIHAGEAINIVPDRCVCGVDIRTVPGTDHGMIQKEMEMLTEKLRREKNISVSCRVLQSQAPTETDARHPLIQAAQAAQKEMQGHISPLGGCFFGTDSAIMFRKDGSLLPYLIYGPGDPLQNHKVDEHISISSLTETTKFYIRTILGFLNADDRTGPEHDGSL